MKTNLIVILLGTTIFCSCSPGRQIAKSARHNVLAAGALQTAHVGISVYDADGGKYLYNYQGDKYFVPASNTKIPTCYAALKYLGDSLTGLRFEKKGNDVLIEPTADPTLLHPEFKTQRVFDFLQGVAGKITLSLSKWQDERWGSGWSWNDYSEGYMAERSAMPVYGNVVRFSNPLNVLKVEPSLFLKGIGFDSAKNQAMFPATVNREIASNRFLVGGQSATERHIETPFFTDNGEVVFQLLADTLNKTVYKSGERLAKAAVLHSQPTDSLLKPMMHRSDNFFAEQSLLMVSNEMLGVMNDAKIIDTLLKTVYKDLPQKPHWVDGSGLSRYNLFTPQDFVTILNKMRTDFGMQRIKEILPTGNEGTLTNYYKAENGYIFAKTGTLSGVVSLSGFLYTRKNKLFIFSVLVNNHQASATEVRRAVEKFVEGLREKF